VATKVSHSTGENPFHHLVKTHCSWVVHFVAQKFGVSYCCFTNAVEL